MYCSTILKLIIFVYSHFLTLCLTLFLFSFLSPQRRLSLITSLSHTVGYSGVGRGSGVEVRLGSQIGVVWWRFLGIFGYVFWVYGYAIAWYGGLQRRVHGFPVWFAAARSVCSWVCVNFDLIFFCGSSFGFEICYWFDLILVWIFFVGSWWWSWGLPWWWWWWWKGVEFLLWVICGFMVVKVGGCRGDGGGHGFRG